MFFCVFCRGIYFPTNLCSPTLLLTLLIEEPPYIILQEPVNPFSLLPSLTAGRSLAVI